MKNKGFQKTGLKEKIAQMFIMGFSSDELNQENLNIQNIAKENLGGIILFSENIKSVSQTRKLVTDLQNLSSTPLFVSIDQEGGLVQRNILSKDKINYLSPLALANTKCENSVKKHTKLISDELKAMGINMNFAPSFDVNTNSKNPIIGIRAYGDNVEDVSKYGNAVFKTYQDQDIIPVGKHFPGHGDSSLDSHHLMPTVEFNNLHLAPFKEAIKEGLDVIMIAHVFCSNFSTDNIPASICPEIIGYLRNKMGFDGLIVSDDMVMGGISNEYEAFDACKLAIEAGVNTFIYRYSDDKTLDIIDKIYDYAQENKVFRGKIKQSYKKIMSIKEKYGILHGKDQNIVFDKKIIQQQVEEIATDSVRIIKNEETLPLKETIMLKPDISGFNNIDNSDIEINLGLESITYPINPTLDDILLVLAKIKEYKQVIFISYNALLNKGQMELFKGINKSIISVILGTSDEIKYMDKANSIIVASCPRCTNNKALENKLFDLFKKS